MAEDNPPAGPGACYVVSPEEALRLILQVEFPAHTIAQEYVGDLCFRLTVPRDLDLGAVREAAQKVLPVSIRVEVVREKEGV